MDNPVQPFPILSVSNGSAITHAGEAANRAAADYLFTDYHQRRAAKTIKTQTAALLLWVQYLAEVGAATRLLAEATDWAPVHFDEKVLAEMAEYTVSQQISLPIIYGAHYCHACRLAGRTWGLVEGFVKWLLNQGYSLASVNNRLSAVKVYTLLAAYQMYVRRQRWAKCLERVARKHTLRSCSGRYRLC